MSYDYRGGDDATGIGHIGTSIENSPIHVHIHIHAAIEPVAARIARVIYGMLGRRHYLVESAALATDDELSRRIVRIAKGQ